MASDEKKTSNKTALILYVLEILKKYTDIDHPMDYKEISAKLESDYGIIKKDNSDTCIDRGTVASYVEIYNNLNYNVKHSPRKGYYIENNLFSFGEATFLIDTIFASKSLTGEQAVELTTKIANTLPISQSKEFDYLKDALRVNRAENDDFYNIVETLCKAIIEQKKVSFHITTYNTRKQKMPRSVNSTIVTPFSLVVKNDVYYLNCYSPKFKAIINVRIDDIENLKLLKEPATPINEVPGFENNTENYFDEIKYSNEHPYFTELTKSKPIKARLKLPNKTFINKVLNCFDKNTTKIQYQAYQEFNCHYYAIVKADKISILNFCLQNDNVELVEPDKLRLELKDILQKKLQKHNKLR